MPKSQYRELLAAVHVYEHAAQSSTATDIFSDVREAEAVVCRVQDGGRPGVWCTSRQAPACVAMSFSWRCWVEQGKASVHATQHGRCSHEIKYCTIRRLPAQIYSTDAMQAHDATSSMLHNITSASTTPCSTPCASIQTLGTSAARKPICNAMPIEPSLSEVQNQAQGFT